MDGAEAGAEAVAEAAEAPRRQVHAKAAQPPRRPSGGDGGSGGAVQLLQSAWQAAVTPRTQRARAAAVKQLQSAWRGRVARCAAAARRASAYRTAAAARLAAARYKNDSVRVGAEDLMSVLNEERGVGRRFTRAECEFALRASGSGGWAYPENPQDWLGAQQLLKVRVRVTVTVRVS